MGKMLDEALKRPLQTKRSSDRLSAEQLERAAEALWVARWPNMDEAWKVQHERRREYYRKQVRAVVDAIGEA